MFRFVCIALGCASSALRWLDCLPDQATSGSMQNCASHGPILLSIDITKLLLACVTGRILINPLLTWHECSITRPIRAHNLYFNGRNSTQVLVPLKGAIKIKLFHTGRIGSAYYDNSQGNIYRNQNYILVTICTSSHVDPSWW